MQTNNQENPQEQVQPLSVEMDETMAIYCLGQHLRRFFEQSNAGQVAEFVQPCVGCVYAKKCKMDWIAVHNWVEKKTGIPTGICLISK